MDFPASDMSHSRRSFELQGFFVEGSNVQTQFGQPSDVGYFVKRNMFLG